MRWLSFFKNNVNLRIVIALVPLSGIVASCGTVPSEEASKEHLQTEFPAYIALNQVSFEFVKTSQNRVLVKFGAEVRVREDLFILEKQLEGDTKTNIVKMVSKSNEDKILYGRFGAQKLGRAWNFGAMQMESPIGEPISRFSRPVYVLGTEEADSALQQYKSQLSSLAPANSVYSGSIIHRRMLQNIRIKVIERTDAQITLEMSNPGTAGINRLFTGTIDTHGDNPVIVVRPVTSQEFKSFNVWEIYKRDGEVRLEIKGNAIEGTGQFGSFQYTFRLFKRPE
jgi:hypothetical protein